MILHGRPDTPRDARSRAKETGRRGSIAPGDSPGHPAREPASTRAGAGIGVELAAAGFRWRRMLAASILMLSAACGAPGGTGSGAVTTHPGFDTYYYPGAETLQAWREASPYRWIGFYLPAPCHRERSWEGRRAEIERMGWGIAILYVGQQAFEGIAPADGADGTPIICSQTLLTDAQGRLDAVDAVQAAAREGFVPGSIIHLDVEKMIAIPDSMRVYYAAWQREVLRDGRYLPGTYAHQLNAVALLPLAEAAFREAGRTGTPPFWVAGGSEFSLDRPAWAIGLPFVRIWQGVLDVQRTWGGRSLLVDENVATSPSPSAPLIP